MVRTPIALIILAVILASCIRQSGTSSEGNYGNNTDYARGFDIEIFNNYKILHVFDPWQGSDGVHFRYVLAGSGVRIPDSLSGLPLVRVPVKRIVCMSTTHIAMIGALERTETIVGISGREYISDVKLGKSIESGLVRDVGAEHSLNYELIVSMNPDVILTYGVTSEVNVMVHRLKDLGIPVILNGDYLENHPLGKLEWLRFVAAFYNEDEMADSLFREIEQKYLNIREKSLNAGSSPTVMTGLPWKGSWYIPGGTSFAAAFIKDAGGSFLWEDAPNHEALPISMEAVYSRASSADIWINCGAAVSMPEIKNTDIRLKEFKPYQTGRVFNNTARLNSKGGNDIWESGVLNPHLILADLVKIFHPEILSDHELVYYEKLE